jgi:hypothetical protein
MLYTSLSHIFNLHVQVQRRPGPELGPGPRPQVADVNHATMAMGAVADAYRPIDLSLSSNTQRSNPILSHPILSNPIH